jgi:hypothetical protein
VDEPDEVTAGGGSRCQSVENDRELGFAGLVATRAAVTYLTLISTVVTFWIEYPTIRGPLQAVASMLVFAAMAVPTRISAVRRQ